MARQNAGSVLVTDGDTRSALAIARSLGRRGVPVWIGASRWSALGAFSRYARGRLCHPAPERDSQGFLRAVEQACRDGRADLLFPTTDVALHLLSEHRERFPARCLACLPGRDAVRAALDKGAALDLAQRLGVPVPSTHAVHSATDLQALAPGLQYPVVVKTRRSRVPAAGSWRAGGHVYASSPDELLTACARLRPIDPAPLIQEYVPGSGHGLFALADQGQVVALFAHRRLTEDPPSGGVSVVSESCPPHPAAREAACALLRALHWHGVAMVEFRLDARDGLPKLMEINGRFWGSLELAIRAGMDFPWLLYRMAQDGRAPAPAGYRLGVRNRWLMGDLDRLVAALFSPRPGPGVAWPARSRAVREFLGLAQRGARLEVERADDPLPALAEAGAYGWRLFRSAMNRLLENHGDRHGR